MIIVHNNSSRKKYKFNNENGEDNEQSEQQSKLQQLHTKPNW